VTAIAEGLTGALDGHRLLQHPFYRRWVEGTLGLDELRVYAAQYRHIERAQPRWLAGVAERVDNDAARTAVTRVLDDEIDAEGSHADLFDRFAEAIGAPIDMAPSPATVKLLNTLDELVDSGPVFGLGGLLAYELQSPEVSREKADGLRRHFDLDGDATAFWNTHAELDERHSAWLLEALEASGGSDSRAVEATRRAAVAWWAFLDEREAARPTVSVSGT